MTAIFLGIGSNTERDLHLARGLDALQQLVGPLDLSPVFESEAVGVLGRRFYNMVVGAHTHLSLQDLNAALKAIEAACGRGAIKPMPNSGLGGREINNCGRCPLPGRARR